MGANMDNPIRLALCVGILTAATACSIQPSSTIVATDLRDQAKSEVGRFSGLFSSGDDTSDSNAEDPFVANLNNAQEKYEKHFLDKDGKAPVNDDHNLQIYVEGRFSQINDLCKIYFDGLVKRQQANEIYKGATSLASNIASGILGLTGAAALQLSALALGESAALAGLEGYEEVYLLGPTPEVVYKRVRDEQSAFRTNNATAIAAPQHYPQVRNLVRDYAALCTPERIRQVVDEAVGGTNNTGRARLAEAAKAAFVTIIGTNTLGITLDQDQAADMIIALGLVGDATQKMNADLRLQTRGVVLSTLRANSAINAKIDQLEETLKTLKERNVAPELFALAENRKALGAS